MHRRDFGHAITPPSLAAGGLDVDDDEGERMEFHGGESSEGIRRPY